MDRADRGLEDLPGVAFGVVLERAGGLEIEEGFAVGDLLEGAADAVAKLGGGQPGVGHDAYPLRRVGRQELEVTQHQGGGLPRAGAGDSYLHSKAPFVGALRGGFLLTPHRAAFAAQAGGFGSFWHRKPGRVA